MQYVPIEDNPLVKGLKDVTYTSIREMVANKNNDTNTNENDKRIKLSLDDANYVFNNNKDVRDLRTWIETFRPPGTNDFSIKIYALIPNRINNGRTFNEENKSKIDEFIKKNPSCIRTENPPLVIDRKKVIEWIQNAKNRKKFHTLLKRKNEKNERKFEIDENTIDQKINEYTMVIDNYQDRAGDFGKEIIDLYRNTGEEPDVYASPTTSNQELTYNQKMNHIERCCIENHRNCNIKLTEFYTRFDTPSLNTNEDVIFVNKTDFEKLIKINDNPQTYKLDLSPKAPTKKSVFSSFNPFSKNKKFGGSAKKRNNRKTKQMKRTTTRKLHNNRRKSNNRRR
jgi:hypothetical protein